MKTELFLVVDGYLCDGTELTDDYPPKARIVVVGISRWYGDHIIDCFPAVIVSDVAKELVENSHISGVRFVPAEVIGPWQATHFPADWWHMIIGHDASQDVYQSELPPFQLYASEVASEVIRSAGRGKKL